MSVEAITWVFKQKTGSYGCKTVLVALANFADQTGYCYPSQRLIAEMTECGQRSVRRYLQQLEGGGFITRCPRRRDDGSYTTDGFTLNMQQASLITSGQLGRRPKASSGHPGRWPDTTDPAATQAVTGGQSLAEHEPSVNRHITVSSAASAVNPRPTAIIITYDFEKRSFANVSELDIEGWGNAYPAIDVSREIAAAAVWLDANPKNRKSNYKRFLVSWFSRSQNHARPAGGAIAARKANPLCEFTDKAGTRDCSFTPVGPCPHYGGKQLCQHHTDKVTPAKLSAERIAEHLANTKRMIGRHA